MQNGVFLDYGTNKFQGLELVFNRHKMDTTWTVHTYEANELLFNWGTRNVGPVEKRLGVTIHRHHGAVWKESGVTNFMAPGTTEKPTGGGHVQQIGKKHRPGVRPQLECDTLTRVRLIDVVDTITPHIGRPIVIKMDIEGAEYPVLRRMIDADVAKHVGTWFIEFHARLMSDAGHHQRVQRQLLRELRKTGTVHQWH